MTANLPEAVPALRATGLLGAFNAAGVIELADFHTADAIGRLTGDRDEQVALALALAVRALRLGSVCIDLATVADDVFETTEDDVPLSELPWPEPETWLASCKNSPALTAGAEGAGDRPLRLVGEHLYLERYWQQEESVRQHLLARLTAAPPVVDADRLATGLDRLFTRDGLTDNEPDRQRGAAEACVRQWLTVVAGGPGTGKTTTVAKLLAVLADQSTTPPRVALAAPTGKAAARLTEAIATARGQLEPIDAARISDLAAVTLHRLLGWLPGNRGRFRHHAGNRLPYDVIVVDEMSMVSLTMMARLLEAVRPDARLVLVGDPDQLSSVEAGAVLADITGALGSDAADQVAIRSTPAVVQLRRTWRYAGAIEELAEAIRASDPDAAIRVLRQRSSGESAELIFVETDLTNARPAGLEPLIAAVAASGAALRAAATAGDVPAALAALDGHRLLCAHRHGPYGVARWSLEVERWLSATAPAGYADQEWYLGRPLLITANDYDLGLFNGDTGVVVMTDRGLRAAFGRGDHPKLIAPARLDAVQSTYAMTVHRAQGSQFELLSLLLPPAQSPLLTRELLYTAVTRASRQVQIFGSEEAIRRAIQRPANRASGLRDRLNVDTQKDNSAIC